MDHGASQCRTATQASQTIAVAANAHLQVQFASHWQFERIIIQDYFEKGDTVRHPLIRVASWANGINQEKILRVNRLIFVLVKFMFYTRLFYHFHNTSSRVRSSRYCVRSDEDGERMNRRKNRLIDRVHSCSHTRTSSERDVCPKES